MLDHYLRHLALVTPMFLLKMIPLVRVTFKAIGSYNDARPMGRAQLV